MQKIVEWNRRVNNKVNQKSIFFGQQLIHDNLFTTDVFSIQQAIFSLAVLFQTATIALNIEIGIFFRKAVTNN